MKKYTTPLVTSLLMVGAAQADTTLSFTNLSTAFDSTNSLTVGGFTTADAELSVTGVADGNNFKYTVTYTGSSFDGDLINDTLSFDVLVQGWTGSSASTSFTDTDEDVNANSGVVTTIGNTDAAVDITDERWTAVDGLFDAGETLEFTLQNFTLTTNLAYDGSPSGSFTGTSYQETGRGYGHLVVIGDVGSDLFETRFNATDYSIAAGSLDEGEQMYLTAADPVLDGLTYSNVQRFGVNGVDFTITIPEPSSYVLLAGLLGLSYAMVRRRK
ncbi:PEP-CTERM sorting domain-containing protein [Coraliomargarita sp. SDUM461003]|uniref:PEP-CTERM sorting domain-containing protein n=1 Tax=Thalassobacterium maritimum TaxID=3041265 RepID=A0ABU1AWK5_9BACT|nr:PEP-CTERM sorting domain-containing protein [Coraliomargarita sp. SDUM461003]MDQ8207367.1 PEP-CTERM sorting domain-containing protein [Coraliomargarita sp. SDUM461003]